MGFWGKNADYKGPIDELNISKDDMEKLHNNGEVEIDGEKVTFKNEESINEYEAYVAYATKGNKIVKTVRDSEYNDKLFSKFKKDMERKGLKVYIDLVKNRKAVRQVYRTNESINEGPSTQEFKIAAMAVKKQAKFRNVSPEQAIQDQLNALKLLQRYIKKGDVKKYTGVNLSESKFEVGKVYDNPYHTAFKSESQIKEEENSVNEMQVVNKKTGKDITRYVLDLLSGKIDKKKFEKLTGLKKESLNEVDDHEVGMGLSSLKSSVRSAKVIYDNIKKRNIEELDGWVQEKLTLASDYLKNVADYMEDLDEYDKDGNNN